MSTIGIRPRTARLRDRASSLRRILCFSLILTLPILPLTSCVESLHAHNSILTRLANRGPVALSQDNPYLAANLLLTKEMESSADVKGFIEKRGIPSALEIQHEFFTPVLLYLYYLAEQQVYTLEETADTWLIRGPELMSSDILRKVSAIAAFQKGGKLPMPGEAFTSIAPGLPQTAQTPLSTPPEAHQAVQGPANLERMADSHASVQPAGDASLVAQLVRGHERELAEISPRGDIVHYVTFASETLRAISRWYTLDAVNEGKIQRINLLKDGKKLSPGDTIVIPAYLARNKVRMTEEAAKRLGTP